jgi:hypothetical protein
MTKLKWMRKSWKTSTSKTKVDLIVHRIQKTSLALVILTILIAILIWYPLSNFTGNVYYDPRCYLDVWGLSYRFQVTVWILTLIVCLWFIIPCLVAKPLKSSTDHNVEFSSDIANNQEGEQRKEQENQVVET